MRNRVCRLFDIRYPIIQGAMRGVSEPTLAAAVSNAGGLGMLSGVTSVPRLREEIKRLRELTDRPFGVSLPFILLREELVLEILNMLSEEKVGIVTTAAGDPMIASQYLREARLTWIHVVATVSHAKRAEMAGVNAIVASGFEAGGFLGRGQITTLALVPQVVEAVKVPVIAAGGIGDARGFLAAFALGAEGVQMGTRFIASHECQLGQDYKSAIMMATDSDTFVSDRDGRASRRLKARSTREASPESGRNYGAGQVAGLIKEVISVDRIIQQIIQGAQALAFKLDREVAGF